MEHFFQGGLLFGSSDRAVHRFSNRVIGKDMIEVESAIPKGLGHVGGVVFTQDVEGEAAGTGHVSRIVSDPAFVLVTRDITDIVVAVLDAPMANGQWPATSPRWFHRPVAAEYSKVRRVARMTVLMKEGLPLGPSQGVGDREDLNGSIFLAGSACVVRERSVGGRGVVRNGTGGSEQIGLVGLPIVLRGIWAAAVRSNGLRLPSHLL
jgi:hypothetical protein